MYKSLTHMNKCTELGLQRVVHIEHKAVLRSIHSPISASGTHQTPFRTGNFSEKVFSCNALRREDPPAPLCALLTLFSPCSHYTILVTPPSGNCPRPKKSPKLATVRIPAAQEPAQGARPGPPAPEPPLRGETQPGGTQGPLRRRSPG